MVQKFTGRHDFLSQIEKGKATFLLTGSVTNTINIEGITQAGIPGMIHLTPTLDAEFVDSGKLFSLDVMAETPKGVPTPAIITRAIKQLTGIQFEMLDLGLRVKPQVSTLHSTDLQESGSIIDGANIYARNVIETGIIFAKNYTHENDYLILAESTPSGTTTAYATAKALGYMVDGLFSSSFLDSPVSLKQRVVDAALKRVANKDEYTKLGAVSDNMLLFCAGFVSEYGKHNNIVLAGGTQMAAVLLIIDKLNLDFNETSTALMTTTWVVNDPLSDIASLLDLPKFQTSGYYTDFNFNTANIPVLKLYDKGEAKEGVGAGAALCYARLKGFTTEQIVKEIEKVLTT